MVTQLNEVPQEKLLKWASVNVQEVIDSGFRLKAGTYGIEARQVKKDLERCGWDIVRLETFITNAFYGGRSKRIYINKNNKNAVGF